MTSFFFLLIFGVFIVNLIDFSSSTQTLNMRWVLSSVSSPTLYSVLRWPSLSQWLQLPTFRWCEILYLYLRSLSWVLEQQSHLLVDGITWMYQMILKLITHSFIISPYIPYSASFSSLLLLFFLICLCINCRFLVCSCPGVLILESLPLSLYIYMYVCMYVCIYMRDCFKLLVS